MMNRIMLLVTMYCLTRLDQYQERDQLLQLQICGTDNSDLQICLEAFASDVLSCDQPTGPQL